MEGGTELGLTLHLGVSVLVFNAPCLLPFSAAEVFLPVGERFNIHFYVDVGIQSLSVVCSGRVSLPARHRSACTD